MTTFRLPLAGLLVVAWLAISACGQQDRPQNLRRRTCRIFAHPGSRPAVMVTVELDFGAKPPSIAQALHEIERRYEPDDGQGRTFAIIEAYGEPTTDGKLHISMHVSAEKPASALCFPPHRRKSVEDPDCPRDSSTGIIFRRQTTVHHAGR